MEKQDLISVIIPVYNVEKYLPQCINSVLEQSYQNFEIILVNDGSKDTSGAICDNYSKKDSRIKVIHQENAGASAARNTGLKIVSGEYVYFLDGDDWLERNAFEEMVKSMQKEQTDFVFFDAYSIDENSGNISKKHYSHKETYKNGKGHEIMKQLLTNKEFHVAPWSMFFRTKFLMQSKIYFEEGIIYEDMLFAYQVFSMAQKVAYVPAYLYFRRYRENSVMTSKVVQKNFVSAVKVYEQVRDYSEKLTDDRRCDEYIVKCAYNAINVYDRLSSKDKKTYQDEYIRMKRNIVSNQAYGDRALQLRCYGKIWWFIYKVLTKMKPGR